MKRLKQEKGITLIALVITIVILIILATISINVIINGGIINKATEASENAKRTSAEEKVKMMLADYEVEKRTKGSITLEVYMNKQKEKGELDKVTNNGDGTLTVETEGYEVIIEDDEEKIVFEVIVTKTNGDILPDGEKEKEKAITIDIKNITDFVDNYTIEVKDNSGNTIKRLDSVVGSVTGQASYIINESGKYTITVKATSKRDGIEKISSKEMYIRVALETTTAKLNRANGVIEIVWLDKNNNVISEPLSPKTHLGGLTAIKYDETKTEWVEADTSNKNNDWYKYEAQTGTTTSGGTSKWANARVVNEGNEANFVWIPRYAYKITYFDTKANKEKYRANSNSKTGIIGYSTIEGFVDVSTGKELLVEGSEPTNIDINKPVKTPEYAEYIPHPAFEFDGAREGIWIGKYESSGVEATAVSNGTVNIVPNADSLIGIIYGNMFEASKKLKTKYELAENSDSHILKNIEWGCAAYLADSKYGRNGTELTANEAGAITGGGKSNAYKSNVLQSTTGNIYGIYDMSGGAWELVAGVSSLSNGDYYNFTTIDEKYYDRYTNVYNESKTIKGDAIYETSTDGNGSSAWNSDISIHVGSPYSVFTRSSTGGTDAGVFAFSNNYGQYPTEGFRVCLIN